MPPRPDLRHRVAVCSQKLLLHYLRYQLLLDLDTNRIPDVEVTSARFAAEIMAIPPRRSAAPTLS